MRHIQTQPGYAADADIDEARISWRTGLGKTATQVTADKAGVTARLAEIDAALAEISPHLAAAEKRAAEAAAIENTADETQERMRADLAAGRCSLDDLAHARARVDVAREVWPALRAVVRDLSTQVRDLESSQRRAHGELRALEAVAAWETLQAALAPAHAAIAAWFELTQDAAILIGGPDYRK
ncbi:MAG: hypothetical protein JSS31_14660 [Proteobacteria bacterium]|nr:hypothetical protein [Pseudomonadota bacterium]MBS0495155.1 hypothetical protein [Pseudomonadota bacterium]